MPRLRIWQAKDLRFSLLSVQSLPHTISVRWRLVRTVDDNNEPAKHIVTVGVPNFCYQGVLVSTELSLWPCTTNNVSILPWSDAPISDLASWQKSRVWMSVLESELFFRGLSVSYNLQFQLGKRRIFDDERKSILSRHNELIIVCNVTVCFKLKGYAVVIWIEYKLLHMPCFFNLIVRPQIANYLLREPTLPCISDRLLAQAITTNSADCLRDGWHVSNLYLSRVGWSIVNNWAHI